MGNCICSSFETTEVVTAKVVVHDGRMQEFSYPVKVSYLLQLYPTCFICDSDEISFDDVVTAVHEDEELKPGQLYFALPLNQLKRHLPPQEMAALAVTASSAFAKSGEKCGSRRNQIIVFSGEENAKPGRRVAPEGDGCGSGCGGVKIDVMMKGKNKSCGGGGGSGRGKSRGKFKATLSSIPEQG